ncbi:MAG: DUF6197 family protein [Mycobacteriaceae bacterium]
METYEVLNKAADLIGEHGWRRGFGWNEGGALCLEGGIMAALGIRFGEVKEGLPFGGLWTRPAYRAVADYLGRDVTITSSPSVFGNLRVSAPLEPLWKWNDTNGRTASEVIEVLRACAVIEQARADQLAAEATYMENLALVSA